MMADWTDIGDNNLEPGAPIRSTDGVALRDNPVAIAEGAAGAPRITGVSGPVVQSGGLWPPSAGGNVVGRFFSGESRTSGYYYARFGKRMTVLRTGRIRLRARHRVFGSRFSSSTSGIRFLINGSTVQSWSTQSRSYQTRNVNAQVDVGDLVEFEMRFTNGEDTSQATDVQVRCDINYSVVVG